MSLFLNKKPLKELTSYEIRLIVMLESTYVFFRRVVDAVGGPEEVDFVSHAMEPIVGKVDAQKGEDASPNVLIKVKRSPVSVDVAVDTKFQSF